MTLSVRRILPFLTFVLACGPSSRSVSQLAASAHAVGAQRAAPSAVMSP